MLGFFICCLVLWRTASQPEVDWLVIRLVLLAATVVIGQFRTFCIISTILGLSYFTGSNYYDAWLAKIHHSVHATTPIIHATFN
jgi:hypothetical protein